MNSTHTLPPLASSPRARPTPASPFLALDRMQTRFASRVVSRLAEGAENVSPDIGERLRFAREQALVRARSARVATAAAPGAAALTDRSAVGGAARGWRWKFAAVIPALALVGGLALIQNWQDNAQISVAAEIDAALLSDDLPPTAYSDAGFVEYLKTPGE